MNKKGTVRAIIRRIKVYRFRISKELPLALSIPTIWLAGLFLVATYPKSPNHPVSPPTPTQESSSPSSLPPDLSARFVFVMDLNSSEVLYSKSADEQVAPASTTKMMTALVVNRHFSLDDQLTVGKKYPEGSNISLTPGEELTVDSLLYALLVQSANDSAEVLAENFCIKDSLCGRDVFVNEMNNLARSMGLKHTNFKNPTGLDEEGHYSSAADLARIAMTLLKDPTLAAIVSTENAIVTTTDYQNPRLVTNVNELLGKVPGVLGVKTGFTDLAGQSLVTLVDRDGRKILISLLGSQARFADTKFLIDWIYD